MLIGGAFLTIVLAAIFLLFLAFPQDDAQLFEEYWSLRSASPPAPCGMLSVMTLNVRREGVESADARHFIHRRHRIAALLERIQPTIIGTQEAISSQVHALQPLLPTHYSVVGYEGEGHRGVDLDDPSRRYDYRTAIWYDRRYFQLVASDHVWLSSTQQRDSRSWGSALKSQLAPCTLHYALCTMHSALCTLHYALCFDVRRGSDVLTGRCCTDRC
jgi:hypothetical protein